MTYSKSFQHYLKPSDQISKDLLYSFEHKRLDIRRMFVYDNDFNWIVVNSRIRKID